MLNSLQLSGQDLSTHRWEDRLVLILADDTTNPQYLEQLSEFRSQKQGMQERKLIVYHITPTQYRTGLDNNGHWQNSEALYNQFKRGNTPFEVLLIGLDGGTKLRQTEVLTCLDLFATIDGMPMRRAEMRNRN